MSGVAGDSAGLAGTGAEVTDEAWATAAVTVDLAAGDGDDEQEEDELDDDDADGIITAAEGQDYSLLVDRNAILYVPVQPGAGSATDSTWILARLSSAGVSGTTPSVKLVDFSTGTILSDTAPVEFVEVPAAFIEGCVAAIMPLPGGILGFGTPTAMPLASDLVAIWAVLEASRATGGSTTFQSAAEAEATPKPKRNRDPASIAGSLQVEPAVRPSPTRLIHMQKHAITLR